MDDEKISKGVRMLKDRGYQVERQIEFGKTWWEIKDHGRATAEEIENLADGVYSVDEQVETLG